MCFEQWLFYESMEPYNSFGNGGAVRASPIGFAVSTAVGAFAEAERCAAPTHNLAQGVRGAQAVALAAFLAWSSASKQQIFSFRLDNTGAQCVVIDCGTSPMPVLGLLLQMQRKKRTDLFFSIRPCRRIAAGCRAAP